jgi:hypothetical protein
MMSNSQITKNSINDLAYIQRLLKKIESNEFSMPLNKFAVDINIFFQSLCLVFAIFLAGYELMTEGRITSSMLLSAQDSELGSLGMQTVLIILFALVVIFYFLVWRASIVAKRDFNMYLEANFKFLKNLSLVSDLLVKFVALYLLVATGQAQFVSLLLILFIGDYLIQGRYFNLPFRISAIGGLLSFILCSALYYLKKPDLIYPVVLFVAMTITSILYLLKDKKSIVQELLNETY